MSRSASVEITVTPVNDAPVVTDMYFKVHATQTLRSLETLLAAASDVDFDALTVPRAPKVPPNQGTLTILPNARIVYEHANSSVMPDSFVFEVCDPLACTAATAHVEVLPLAHAMLQAKDDRYAVAFGNTLRVDAPGVLANDVGGDNGALTVELLPLPLLTEGTLTLSPGGGFEYKHTGGGSTDIFA